jgi:DNA end-binding protein Ku
VREAKAAFADIPDKKPDPKMVEIAAKIIEQQEGPFDPTLFNDRYEEALKALIDEKMKGHKPVEAPEAPSDTKVSDLMEALRSSLTRGAAPAERRPATAKAAAKPAGRRPPARKKAG